MANDVCGWGFANVLLVHTFAMCAQSLVMIGPPASVNTFCTTSTVSTTTMVLIITVRLISREMSREVCLECRLWSADSIKKSTSAHRALLQSDICSPRQTARCRTGAGQLRVLQHDPMRAQSRLRLAVSPVLVVCVVR